MGVPESDHCRIGSLEMQADTAINKQVDHCRIGSLETDKDGAYRFVPDHCRIGSLEIYDFTFVCEVT